MINDRWPVIVGVAQLEQRDTDPLEAREPLVLMTEATLAAAADAGLNAAAMRTVDSVRVVLGIWPYKNPAKVVAERIGATGAQTGLTPIGGNQVQSAVNQTALDILEGRNDLVVLCGAECGNTQGKARKAGVQLKWSEAPGTPDATIGHDMPMGDDAARARGIRAPIQIYPMFDNAMRYARGESIPSHLERVSKLWAGFSKVASQNPHAWIREPVSAETIRTATPANRPVSFPYPKLMNSNSHVDQSAALLMCSAGTARRLGIPSEKWVYLWSGSDAHDHLQVSQRDNLHSSPAIRIAGRRALDLAGVSTEDLAHVDLYSCFPSAVQVSANELGLSHDRPLTVTGGLTFGGGPLNNYVMHAVATMVTNLRRDRGKPGLVTANGGYLTKHAFGVYCSEPPPRAYQHQDVQDEVNAAPKREAAADHDGAVEVETYTVMFGDGPQMAHCACLTPDGRRTWANTSDKDVMSAMLVEEFCGKRATVDGHGSIGFG